MSSFAVPSIPSPHHVDETNSIQVPNPSTSNPTVPTSPPTPHSHEFLQNSREILNQIFKAKMGKTNIVSAEEVMSPRDVKKSKALLTSFFGAKLLPKPIPSVDEFDDKLDSPHLESDDALDQQNNIWAKLRDCSMGDGELTADDATEILLLLESLINADIQKSHEEVVESIFQSIDKEDLKTIDEDFLRYLSTHYAKLQNHDAETAEFNDATSEKQETLPVGAEDIALTEKLRPSPEVIDVLAKFHDWDFNVFELERLTPYPLVLVGEAVLSELNLTWKLELNVARLRRFLLDIQDAYLAKPYHNYIHATDCTQTMFHFLTEGRIQFALGINELSTLALVLGAAIHDVGHPGVTGRYLISISDPLAIQYNDNSPLENMHLSTAFNIWMRPGNNFTERLPKAQFRELRRMIIEIVLFTDNDKHFALMEKLESLFSSGDINNLQPAAGMSTASSSGGSVLQPSEPRALMHKKSLPSDDMKVIRRAATDILVRNNSSSTAHSPLTLQTIEEGRDSPNALGVDVSATPSKAGTLRRSASSRVRPMSLGTPIRHTVDNSSAPSPARSSTPVTPGLAAVSFTAEPRQLLMMQVALHAADVSNPVKPWPLHMRWYPRLMEEFYYQGDLEREQGMPITFAFDRHNPVPLPKFQLGFLKAIVSPMYKTFSKVPGATISHCLTSLENNIKNWELLLSMDETGERIRTAADVAEATASWPVSGALHHQSVPGKVSKPVTFAPDA